MATDDRNDVQAIWQSQGAATTPPAADEIRRRVEQMDKRVRRQRFDSYLAAATISIGLGGIAFLFPNPTLIAGAVLAICGVAFVGHEARRGRPSHDDAVAALEHHRELLQQRLDFHRKRLWLRVFTLAPGGILFFIGFARALPKLAPFIYFQLATFLFALALIVPLNRRAAVKVQQEIDELERLRQA